MSSSELSYFRGVFLDILRNYSINNNELFNENNSKNAGGDVIDLLNSDRDNVINLKLMGRERLYIKKVMKALERIDSRTFGVCSDCDSNIEASRLRARPTATLCISCKEAEEREESNIIYHMKSHTLGKQLDSNIINLPIRSEEIAKEQEYLKGRDLDSMRPLER